MKTRRDQGGVWVHAGRTREAAFWKRRGGTARRLRGGNVTGAPGSLLASWCGHLQCMRWQFFVAGLAPLLSLVLGREQVPFVRLYKLQCDGLRRGWLESFWWGGGKRFVMGLWHGSCRVAILALGGGPDGWLLVLWVMRWRYLNGGWDGTGWSGR